jgi:hypothetical protein
MCLPAAYWGSWHDSSGCCHELPGTYELYGRAESSKANHHLESLDVHMRQLKSRLVSC